ncbi:protein UXT-like isoform X2 [Oratosquilla oratoria]|uniref:protein UXT-like isoform X2 n=1 Tax=Oratosquilla oratoria TaxID=337810 RepID=UPI003F75CC04
MDYDEKIKKYEHFLNDVLRKDLMVVLEERDKLYESIAEFSQLKQTIKCIQDSSTEDGLRSQVDLGSNFYVQAHVPDVSYIYVDVGLGFHVELTLDEAVKFSQKKIDILTKKVEESTKKSAKIKAQIKFVLEGLRELQKL